MIQKVVATIALACSFAVANAAPSNGAVLAASESIEGFGTAWPNATNISKSKDFHVYEWKSNGLRLIQINHADGRVVTVASLDGTVLTPLPIGQWQGRSKELAGSSKAPGATLADGSFTCPCSSKIVYDDGYTRIVVVMDSQGRVIDVITVKEVIQ